MKKGMEVLACVWALRECIIGTSRYKITLFHLKNHYDKSMKILAQLVSKVARE